MRRIAPAALTLLVIIAGVSPLAAQSGSVQPGAVIKAHRVAGAGDALVGTLVSRTADSLTLVTRGSDALVRIPATSVTSIEVLNGKRRLAPAAKWAVVGGGLWGIVATVVPYDNCATRRTEFCSDSRADFVAMQALGMAAIMGVVGAIRGEDKWTRVEGAAPTAIIVPSPRGASVGVRLSL